MIIEEKENLKSLATAALLGASTLGTNPQKEVEYKSNDPYEMVYLNHIKKPYNYEKYKDELYNVYLNDFTKAKNKTEKDQAVKNFKDYEKLYLIKNNKLTKSNKIMPLFKDFYNKMTGK